MDMIGKTILLLDDNPAYLQCVEESLESAGYQVISKTSGCSALSVVAEGGGVDLVITDYQMPFMNGIEFIVALKNMAPTVPIPVIMLTGHGSVETSSKALKLGASEFITKPITMKALRMIVKTTLMRMERGSRGIGMSMLNQ